MSLYNSTPPLKSLNIHITNKCLAVSSCLQDASRRVLKMFHLKNRTWLLKKNKFSASVLFLPCVMALPYSGSQVTTQICFRYVDLMSEVQGKWS